MEPVMDDEGLGQAAAMTREAPTQALVLPVTSVFADPPCPDHEDQQQCLYCNKCSKLICAECMVLDHSNHGVELAKKKRQQVEQDFSNAVDNLRAKIEETETDQKRLSELMEKTELEQTEELRIFQEQQLAAEGSLTKKHEAAIATLNEDLDCCKENLSQAYVAEVTTAKEKCSKALDELNAAMLNASANARGAKETLQEAEETKNVSMPQLQSMILKVEEACAAMPNLSAFPQQQLSAKIPTTDFMDFVDDGKEVVSSAWAKTIKSTEEQQRKLVEEERRERQKAEVQLKEEINKRQEVEHLMKTEIQNRKDAEIRAVQSTASFRAEREKKEKIEKESTEEQRRSARVKQDLQAKLDQNVKEDMRRREAEEAMARSKQAQKKTKHSQLLQLLPDQPNTGLNGKLGDVAVPRNVYDSWKQYGFYSPDPMKLQWADLDTPLRWYKPYTEEDRDLHVVLLRPEVAKAICGIVGGNVELTRGRVNRWACLETTNSRGTVICRYVEAMVHFTEIVVRYDRFTGVVKTPTPREEGWLLPAESSLRDALTAVLDVRPKAVQDDKSKLHLGTTCLEWRKSSDSVNLYVEGHITRR